MKVLRSKGPGMMIAVFGFCAIFPDEIMGQMTINTGCHRMVTRFLPGVKIRSHDMTVYTDFRFGRCVREALGGKKDKQANTKRNTNAHGQQIDPFTGTDKGND